MMSQKRVIVKDKLEPSEKEVWEMELYKQGSEACRNYSQLTMKTRTLSQQVLIVGVVGLSAVIANKDVTVRPEIALVGGITLVAFAISLAFVDWHYQSAFTAIRDSLACMEYRHDLPGPWTAHLGERTHFRDHVASYLPFLLLFVVGCSGVGIGIKLNGGSLLTTVLIVVALILIASGLFVLACSRASTRNAELNKKISEGSRERFL